ncbi:meiosis regulator and mRNA stability factor 1-like protein, partial [Tanacetum coccineum]
LGLTQQFVQGYNRTTKPFGFKCSVSLFKPESYKLKVLKGYAWWLQELGNELIDEPSREPKAVDKAIILDMFQFAFDNPPPSYILLISGDADFARAVSSLCELMYTMVLVVEDKFSPTSIQTLE